MIIMISGWMENDLNDYKRAFGVMPEHITEEVSLLVRSNSDIPFYYLRHLLCSSISIRKDSFAIITYTIRND
jgi:hypothetical protein